LAITDRSGHDNPLDPIGVLLAFVAPVFVPSSFSLSGGRRDDGRGGDQGGGGPAIAKSALRGLGALLIVYSVASTSYVNVGDGRFAQLFRNYGGGSLQGGKIVAIDGENGPQARVLRPGFHWEFLLNVFYEVDGSKKEFEVPAGMVGILTAKDGEPLRPGQTFADPFKPEIGLKMLDAEAFLRNGGQRGPQLTVLPPSKYVINDYLWSVELKPARDVNTGFVGVVKSNVWAAVDFGTLKADKPDKCDVIKPKDAKEGRIEAPIIPAGCVGVWNIALPPGKIYMNPDAFTIIPIDTRAQVWTYAGGYQRCEISLTVDSKGEISQNRSCSNVPESRDNADRAVFVKMEGWDVPSSMVRAARKIFTAVIRRASRASLYPPVPSAHAEGEWPSASFCRREDCTHTEMFGQAEINEWP
jgi:hypothetical protein